MTSVIFLSLLGNRVHSQTLKESSIKNKTKNKNKPIHYNHKNFKFYVLPIASIVDAA